MELDNLKILVLGYGKTGKEVIEFLKQKGNYYHFYDDKDYKNSRQVTFEKLKKCTYDMCIISPGFSNEHRVVKWINMNKIPILSELELSYLLCKGKIIGVTGTNGKTTTVSLLKNIFDVAKKKSILCGNVGVPLIHYINEIDSKTYAICEISSYQLEHISNFKPYIATILNITPDHINHHGNMENYIKCKQNIYKNQTKNDYFVLNQLEENNYKTKSKKYFFSINKKANVYCKNNYIYYKKSKIMNIQDISLLGTKNLLNVLTAICICKICKIKNKHIKEGIISFKPLQHRMEKVLIKKGVLFVNDSKATNIDSTLCALECFKKPILLLGGSDKGYEYDEIFRNKNFKEVVCFGGIKDKLVETAKRNNVQCYQAVDLRQATILAYSLAKKGDIVLLSPASASFDEFISYEDRGTKFCEYVKNL